MPADGVRRALRPVATVAARARHRPGALRMRWAAVTLLFVSLGLAPLVGTHAQSPEPALRLYAGMLRQVADQWHFEPCDSAPDGPHRARDVSPESSITSILTDIGLDRRDTTYIEAFGRLIAGEVRFERLNRAGAELTCASAADPSRHWQAQGNEPFWALRSSSEGLALREPGRQLNVPPVRLQWQPRSSARPGAAVLIARTEMTALAVVLLPRLCKDSMADIAYGYRAEVMLGRPRTARFEGCAFIGTDVPPWVSR